MRSPRSGMLVRASATAPARRMSSTGGESALGHEVLQRLAALVRGVALLVEVDLDREGHAVQHAEWLAGLLFRVGGVGFGAHLVGPYFDDGVDRAVHRVDPLQVGFDDVARRRRRPFESCPPATTPTPATVLSPRIPQSKTLWVVWHGAAAPNQPKRPRV